MPDTEADTCRKFVLPKIYAAGWTDEQISEQRTFTDGRIVVAGSRIRRRPQKRADYLLRYTRDFPIALVEAKARYRTAGEGLQQAKDYAEILDIKFAYATNGLEIVEFDFLTGRERVLDAFPTPAELWARLAQAQGLADQATAERFLAPYYHLSGKTPRYYQDVAINRVIRAILRGQKRVLVTMATGTGKTVVAFQICWKLWHSRWNRSGEHRRPKILYLADRNILIDDPKDKIFIPFGEARWKIENGKISKGREMYFSIYQAIAQDERRPGLYKEYDADFFDLVIVDECHRGSARDESTWREILEYFEPAFQLGMAVIAAAETAASFAGILYTDAPAGGEADAAEPFEPIELETRALVTMPGGWKMSQLESQQPSTTYAEFKREILNEIARCLNMPYNVAAGNSSGYNYASGRLDHQTYFKAIRVEQAHIGLVVLDRVLSAWLDEAVLIEGYLPESLRTLDADRSHQWFWDGHEHVDPLKEASAQATRLSSHTTTLANEYAKQGRDWESELRQRAKELQLMEELGLTTAGPTPETPREEEDADVAEVTEDA